MRATKQRMPKGGFPSGFSEWTIDDSDGRRQHGRWRFCRNVPRAGPDEATRQLWGRDGAVALLVATYANGTTGLFALIA